jgi:hypothetical protein
MVFIDELRSATVEEKGAIYRYCLYTDRLCEEQCFIIRIELQLLLGSFFSSEEMIFCTEVRAIEIFETLVRHRATPANLKYVLEDTVVV